MSKAQEDGLWSWDYKETKSEVTLVLYRHYIYSGLQNCCNVWPFLTELNVVLNRVGIALRVG